MADEDKIHDEDLDALKGVWAKAQDELKEKLVTTDDIEWGVPGHGSDKPDLEFVGGVDISFVKGDPVNASACLVVIRMSDLSVVYQRTKMVELTLPYISGFLAFRECDFLVDLINELRDAPEPETATATDAGAGSGSGTGAGAGAGAGGDPASGSSRKPFPQIIFVDGNGILHPRGFGLACHLGVVAGVPTVGIGKTFLHVDGLNKGSVLELAKSTLSAAGDAVDLKGESGRVWGAAFRATDTATNPIFVSPGHRVSLPTALAVSRLLCKHRVPEPVRQADLTSRAAIRDWLAARKKDSASA